MVYFKVYLQRLKYHPISCAKAKVKYTVVADKMFKANLRTNMKASMTKKKVETRM